MVEARARAETGKVRERIDRALPNLRKEAERVWALLGTVIPAGASGCFTLEPSAVVQGPAEVRGAELHLRFGAVVAPRVTSPCNPGAQVALPPLGREPKLGDGFQLDVRETVAPDELGRVMAEAIRDRPLAAGAFPARAGPVVARSAQGGFVIDVGILAPACGMVAFAAAPRWDAAARVVRFEVAPLAGEAERARPMDALALAQSLAAALVVPLPVTDADARAALADRRAPIGPGQAELSATVASAEVVGVRAAPDGLEARLVVRGAARVLVR
jgi:hypothetical protein